LRLCVFTKLVPKHSKTRMKRSLYLAAAFFAVVGHLTNAYAEPDKKWVIALSNSYFGNTWRRQMVDAFKEAAEQAKKDGRISDYDIRMVMGQ